MVERMVVGTEKEWKCIFRVQSLDMEEEKMRRIKQNFLIWEILSEYTSLSLRAVGVVTMDYRLINI